MIVYHYGLKLHFLNANDFKHLFLHLLPSIYLLKEAMCIYFKYIHRIPSDITEYQIVNVFINALVLKSASNLKSPNKMKQKD